MAKKKTIAKSEAPTPTSPATDEPMRICFERIIPDELDPTAHTRRRLRDVLIQQPSDELTDDEAARAFKARMAVRLSKTWTTGATLRCLFLDGTPNMRKRVKAVAQQWESIVDIKLKFVNDPPAEIRISFYADTGSWSAVGTDALNTAYFPLHQPTMNYGWLRDETSDDEYARVVLHEFGHALGGIHEHQSPKFTRTWNRAAVLKYFQGPPNYWKPEEIETNVLKKYPMNGTSATDYDDHSIMLYAFDGRLFSDNLGPTNTNSSLSPNDISKMKEMYPKKS